MDNRKEKDEFLETYNLPRKNQEEIEKMNKPPVMKLNQQYKKQNKTNKKNSQQTKVQMASQVNSTKHLKNS